MGLRLWSPVVFPQAYGTEFNYCPFLDLSALKHMKQNLITALSWIWVLIIYETKDTFQEFRTMEQDAYWKQDRGPRVLHRLPSNFYLTVINITVLGLYSVQFSCSVVSHSLRPHGLQHARPPCPAPTLELAQTHVCWVSDAIQASRPQLSLSPPAFSLCQHRPKCLFRFFHKISLSEKWTLWPAQ